MEKIAKPLTFLLRANDFGSKTEDFLLPDRNKGLNRADFRLQIYKLICH